MKTIPLLILTLLIFLAGCAPVAVPQAAEPPSPALSDWVWPLPPDPPRIQHLSTFITPKDLGITKGFWAKVWEFIAGNNDELDRIVSPHGLVADGEGKLYVADWGAASVQYLNFVKQQYDQFSKTKKGNLVSPIGAALDGDGLVYISDSVLRRVFVFSGSRNKRIIGEDDSLLRPTGIAINKKEKKLYVVDTMGNCVVIFDLSGTKIASFGKRGGDDGEFNYPTHVTIDTSGDVYVMDTLNFRVQIFDKDGKFLSKFGGTGTALQDFMKPKGIAVDSERHIWVSDGLRDTIQVFDRDGKLLLIFGRQGIGAGEFDVPAGLYIDSKDRLYVADSYNYRVQVFQYLKVEQKVSVGKTD